MPVRKKKKKINKHKANKPLLSKVKLLDAQSIREIRGEAFERFAKCDFKFLPEYCKLLIETKEKTNLLIAGSLLYFMYDKGFHGISEFQNLTLHRRWKRKVFTDPEQKEQSDIPSGILRRLWRHSTGEEKLLTGNADDFKRELWLLTGMLSLRYLTMMLNTPKYAEVLREYDFAHTKEFIENALEGAPDNFSLKGVGYYVKANLHRFAASLAPGDTLGLALDQSAELKGQKISLENAAKYDYEPAICSLAKVYLTGNQHLGIERSPPNAKFYLDLQKEQSSSLRYFLQGTLLLESKKDGAEVFFNLAYQAGDRLGLFKQADIFRSKYREANPGEMTWEVSLATLQDAKKKLNALANPLEIEAAFYPLTSHPIIGPLAAFYTMLSSSPFFADKRYYQEASSKDFFREYVGGERSTLLQDNVHKDHFKALEPDYLFVASVSGLVEAWGFLEIAKRASSLLSVVAERVKVLQQSPQKSGEGGKWDRRYFEKIAYIEVTLPRPPKTEQVDLLLQYCNSLEACRDESLATARDKSLVVFDRLKKATEAYEMYVLYRASLLIGKIAEQAVGKSKITLPPTREIKEKKERYLQAAAKAKFPPAMALIAIQKLEADEWVSAKQNADEAKALLEEAHSSSRDAISGDSHTVIEFTKGHNHCQAREYTQAMKHLRAAVRGGSVDADWYVAKLLDIELEEKASAIVAKFIEKQRERKKQGKQIKQGKDGGQEEALEFLAKPINFPEEGPKTKALKNREKKAKKNKQPQFMATSTQSPFKQMLLHSKKEMGQVTIELCKNLPPEILFPLQKQGQIQDHKVTPKSEVDTELKQDQLKLYMRKKFKHRPKKTSPEPVPSHDLAAENLARDVRAVAKPAARVNNLKTAREPIQFDEALSPITVGAPVSAAVSLGAIKKTKKKKRKPKFNKKAGEFRPAFKPNLFDSHNTDFVFLDLQRLAQSAGPNSVLFILFLTLQEARKENQEVLKCYLPRGEMELEKTFNNLENAYVMAWVGLVLYLRSRPNKPLGVTILEQAKFRGDPICWRPPIWAALVWVYISEGIHRWAAFCMLGRLQEQRFPAAPALVSLFAAKPESEWKSDDEWSKASASITSGETLSGPLPFAVSYVGSMR